MRLGDFFDDIGLGELSSSNVTELEGYEIRDISLPKVIQSLNQALKLLYSKYPFKQSQVIIQLKHGISRYYLDSDYANSNTDSNFSKYILDTAHEPFIDDLLQIQGVFDENGRELSLNDTFSFYSVNTPEYNCVQVSDEVMNNTKFLTVVYRAAHPRISPNEPRNSKVKINIPASFDAVLATYTASLIFMNEGGEAYIQIGNALYAKFKSLEQELNTQGIGQVPETGINMKPVLGDWI